MSARFEHEAVPLRDVLYRKAFRMGRNHPDAQDLFARNHGEGVREFPFVSAGHQHARVAVANFDQQLHQ